MQKHGSAERLGLLMEENRDLTVQDSGEENKISCHNEDEEPAALDALEENESMREEYEALIKTKFKELYAVDTQKLINRRFRKFKVLEERCRVLEETLEKKDELLSQREAELSKIDGEYKNAETAFEARLREEVERAVKEAEDRLLADIRAKRLRPGENAILPRHTHSPQSVASLTRNERAALAKRASNGEKIQF